MRHELQLLFLDDLQDPALNGAYPTAVELHGAVATVHLQVPPGSLETRQDALERVTPYLRARLAETLDLKRTPLLRLRVVGTHPGGAP